MAENPPAEWRLEFFAGYLIPACSLLPSDQIPSMVQGSVIPIQEIPTSFFLPLFQKQKRSAVIGVEFSPEDGQQQNSVRELIRAIAFRTAPEKEDASHELAIRLATVTTRRSPDGLFVVHSGSYSGNARVLLWKFPADESIKASMGGRILTIELIEDAFSRQSSYFKAGIFEGTPANTSFWRGYVEDRQAKTKITEVAEYWAIAFLTARPDMKPTRGTRILARALRKTIREAPTIDLRDSAMSAAITVKGLPGKVMSLRDFAEEYLPAELRPPFLEYVGIPEVLDRPFELEG